MKDYEEYVALKPARYCLLIGLASVHKDGVFFPRHLNAIINISAVIEDMGNAAVNTISALELEAE